MNFNFTDAVRKALARARDEAIRLRHGRIGTEHILLGMLPDPDIVSTLRSFGITPDAVRNDVQARSPAGDSAVTKGEIPYTRGAKKVLEYGMREARKRGDSYVGNEHLLVAVLEEETGIGGQVLRQLGLQPSDGGKTIRSRGVQKNASKPVVRIDDASDRSIYEQIVAQITEAVATGALRSGERLPTVRQLADNLDIAPGTVARAYSELERQGVVVTEGARGTRVAERTTAAVADPERTETLTGLLRPVAVAAFHLGASSADLRTALDRAMDGIFDNKNRAA